MNSRTPSIHLLSDGIIKYDGGSVFGQIPKVLWEQQVRADRWNRVSLGLNCLLIRTEHGNVLVDTGVGSKETGELREVYGLSSSKLGKGLKGVGLTAKDIDKVILTHLHFDHAAGALKAVEDQVVATCPNAVHVVQQGEWEAAIEGRSIMKSSYRPDDLRLLHDQVEFQFTDGDEELFSGLRVVVTGGHTVHHQAVVIEGDDDCVVFAGDLLPTRHHLNPFWIMAYDMDPYQTFVEKQKLAGKICDEGWIIAWDHDPSEPWNRLQRDGDRLLAVPAVE